MVGFVMNGIVNAMKNKTVEEAEVEAKRTVIEYTEKLKGVDNQVRLYVMPPFPRAKIEWTRQLLPVIHETLKVGLAGADNITVLHYLDVADEDFVNDGIHISPDTCAKQFAQVVGELKVLIKARPGKRTTEWSDDINPAAKKALQGVEEQATTSAGGFQARGRGRGRGRGYQAGKGDQAGRDWRSEDRYGGSLEARVDGLAQDVQSLMFESLANWEATDVATNKLNQNVILFDLVPKRLCPENTEAIDVAKALAVSVGMEADLVNAAFFVAGMKNDDTLPRIRVILKDQNAAFTMRTEGLKKRREDTEPWKSLYISNDSTKATRVRVEIMKKIAERIASDNKGVELMVNKYDARPMILFKKERRVTKRISYPEAVQRWGNRLQPEDLVLPKRIAGREFAGRFTAIFGF